MALLLRAAPWLAYLAVGALLEAVALRTREQLWLTLSGVGRLCLRTNTRPGRAALLLGWAALTSWLLPHLWRGPVPGRPTPPPIGGTS